LSAAVTWQRVTIVGCGLIGSSFALALKEVCGPSLRVAGWDASPQALDEALGLKIIDEVDDSLARGEVSASDLIYLAMPVREIVDFLSRCGPQVKPGALITDAGSTKQEICSTARARLPKERLFVGGHPVAGSHLSGPAHARADLFTRAPYVLTVDEELRESPPILRLEETLRRMGARVRLMTAREHDRALAFISHLPQLVSSALVSLVRDQADASALEALAGTGYRDWARLGDSSWLVWRDILATNPAEIADALDRLGLKLAAVSAELRACSTGQGDELAHARAMFRQ
jgi:prephenate dehydrogenase